jgi:hypothetical protein
VFHHRRTPLVETVSAETQPLGDAGAMYFAWSAARSCIAPRYAGTQAGIGVVAAIQRDGVFGVTPVFRQKSDCFHPSADRASAN